MLFSRIIWTMKLMGTYAYCFLWGRRGRGLMVVEFTTTSAISAYHH
jgi:hypothetical protein